MSLCFRDAGEPGSPSGLGQGLVMPSVPRNAGKLCLKPQHPSSREPSPLPPSRDVSFCDSTIMLSRGPSRAASPYPSSRVCSPLPYSRGRVPSRETSPVLRSSLDRPQSLMLLSPNLLPTAPHPPPPQLSLSPHRPELTAPTAQSPIRRNRSPMIFSPNHSPSRLRPQTANSPASRATAFFETLTGMGKSAGLCLNGRELTGACKRHCNGGFWRLEKRLGAEFEFSRLPNAGAVGSLPRVPPSKTRLVPSLQPPPPRFTISFLTFLTHQVASYLLPTPSLKSCAFEWLQSSSSW